jgi:cytochrome c biogenesis protein CcdA
MKTFFEKRWSALFVGLCLIMLTIVVLGFTGIIPMGHMAKQLSVIGGAALVDSINPCAFSMLFLTITFLFSLGRDRKTVTKIGLVYITGIFLVYISIGLGVLQALSFFNVPNGLAKVGALAIIVFAAIGIINEFFPKFPIKLKIPQGTHGILAKFIEKGSIPSAFVLGLLVGMFEFPCTGGPYLFVLGLLHDNATFWSGLGYLIYYNFIFVLPLVIALFGATNAKVAEKIDTLRRQETRKSRLILSLIMVALGAIIFFI